jgi:ATP-dependent helicase/nuclease subunit B
VTGSVTGSDTLDSDPEERTPVSVKLIRSPRVSATLACAREWLAERGGDRPLLLVSATTEAGAELLRREVDRRRRGLFGWQRVTLGRLAAALATPALAERGLTPIGALAAEALVARVLHAMRTQAGLGRYAPAASAPGLPRALARTLAELRLARVDLDALEREAPELREIVDRYGAELESAGLADRAAVFELASSAARAADNADPLLGIPVLLLDVPVANAAERDLVAAVAARAPELLATLPARDDVSAGQLERALGVTARPVGSLPETSSLLRLQTHLFEDTAPESGSPDDSVVVLSAPGESRECVEIARRIRRLAAEGLAFDRIAILLRSPDEYRAHLEEALGRAEIPAYFARGALRPDPAGRAFLALLACAGENLSARRFAEYLSLGEVPDATAGGEPPAAPPPSERWVAPDAELVSEAVAEALSAAARAVSEPTPGSQEPPQGLDAPVAAGTLRAPRRWERLLVDAAVIGGRERWERRLAGLEHELQLDLDALEDPDDPATERIRRDLSDLESLRGYAMPLLDALLALPDRAPWGDWLDALSELASRALRHPERVLSVLAELAPMAPVGPVELEELRGVLGRRLLDVAIPPPRSRYGAVFVAPVDAARGLAFDAVFVPGLAERLFPVKIAEDPILLDRPRSSLAAGLVTNEGRVAAERLMLRLAVAAAQRQLVLSYPRLDLDQARPRVPSFYALEALRAAEGSLPGFDELATRAERVAQARVGWPAPERPEQAIDAAEHDLALLESLLQLDPEQSVGTARYLLTANPHLGRALRFRARRWLASWTPADGLVPPPRGELAAGAREAIRGHGLAERSFSPTALQQYATCPYKFLLYAIHRLAPREEPEAIEELDPLQRGSLVHDVQFALFQRLRDEGLLPLDPQRLAPARAHLDAALDEVAARIRDDLAPAIDRVWEDGVESVRADLREWLRRASEDDSGFVPWRFELAFGLPGRRQADPHSRDEPVELDCGIRLRGSIDLVERREETTGAVLRATDHKTGKERFEPGKIVSGGESLQPVLYALAIEKLFPEATVESGRLSYCTAAGGFAERNVPLGAAARESAKVVAQVIGEALAEPFLPAAPAPGACRWCDYRVVCGPYEELRTGRKPPAALEALQRLRELE